MKTYTFDQFTDSGFYLFRQTYTMADAPHKHNFTELVYIADGVCTQTVNGAVYRASAGDVILIEEGMSHAFAACGKSFTYVNLILTREFLEKYASDALFCAPNGENRCHAVSLPARERRFFESLLEEMTHELLVGSYASLSAVGGMVRTALSLYYRCLHAREGAHTDEGGRFAALLSEIEDKLGEELTLSSLAASCGYDDEYFCRAFKRAVGKSPMAYVTERRVLRAAALLSGTELSVAEVGARCGFSDRSVMARAFKRVLGKRPKDL